MNSGDLVNFKTNLRGLQDWNNVATLRDFSPYGLPQGSGPHNDSAGVYGQVPMPFPMKAFVVGGAWAPRKAPVLPGTWGTTEW